MRVIASYSIKGGVGKTATSVNLAHAAARAGHETLLIDLDPQGASSFYFRLRTSKKDRDKSFFSRKRRLLKNIKGSNYRRLDILPANLAFRNFDIMLNSMQKSKKKLKQILSSLDDDYDLIILDCPPNLTLLAENIFNAADMILVPVIPTTLSERTYDQLLGFFDSKGYKKKKIRPFFSMTQHQNRLHTDTINKMGKKHSSFLKSRIGFSQEIEKMGLHREPVLAYASKKSPVQAYRSLFNEVAKALGMK